jgi:DNA-binding NarL/FixJ family response regulator
MDGRQVRAMDQKTTLRSVVLASADAGLRTKLTEGLAGMRWSVLEAGGGAEAMARVEDARPEALLLDSWLPDLEVGEFALQMIRLYPGMDVLRLDGTQGVDGAAARSPRRNELLHALRLALDGVGFLAERAKHDASPDDMVSSNIVSSDAARGGQTGRQIGSRLELLPDLIGGGEAMQEFARRFPNNCWKRSSLGIRAVRSRALFSRARDGSRRRMAERCFWTRSARCRLLSRQRCCVFWSLASFSGWVKTTWCG